jgi:CubicO group peptidase (beta-lactamase class C family)
MKVSVSFRSFGLAAAVMFVALNRAQRPEAARQPAAASETGAFERAIDGELQRRGGVGATVAVVKDGRVLLAKGFGRRSVEASAAVDENSLFGIGSVTKQFTSAAALLMAQDGKLSVHDKVSKYYPDLTRAGDITLLDLMNHVSGYPDYYPLDFVDRRMQKPIAPDELLKLYAGGPLDFDPGTRWSYSNTGFVLLGRILERVSGQPLGSFLSERIFRPVGMTHTVYEPKAGDGRVVPGYTSFALTRLTPVIREGDGWVGPAGAIYSTAADIARWDIALMGGQVLNQASWELMTTPRLLVNGKSSSYGCGLSVGTRNDLTVFTHGGAVSGFIARNTFVPRTRSAVVVVINNEDGPLANAIVEHALDVALPSARLPVTTGPSAAREDRGAIPHVNGPEPAAEASALFRALQNGRLDRSKLGDEYSAFVTNEKLRAASETLKPLGAIRDASVRSVGERGGMEVSSVRLGFESSALDALMYRSTDGRIQEYLLFRP